jgi:zinc transport system ATP-binding protein
MNNELRIIEVHDLWFSFNGVQVLQNVNLEVKLGDFLALIGPNGGGKTTLLKLMLGLLKPARGNIRIFGRPPREVCHRIGYVPQELHINKGFPIKILDVVLMGRLRHGKKWSHYGPDDKKAGQEALERLEMWEYRNRLIGELSGGQQQRVLLARALVSEPEVLFLDEPVAHVDSKGQTDLYSFLKQLNETVTIVVVSHDLTVIASCFKSVACVNRQVYFHDGSEIPEGMLDMAYLCPVEVVAHGVPHRVLPIHREPRDV